MTPSQQVLVQATRSGARSGLPTAATLSLRQKGVLGSFYAGLLPSLAASAPISAIYTFTYELCKQRLQPLAPPEHLWAVQCASGACASVATSVVFTPTERVKAQLQVGAYGSTPQAVAGILRSGGVSSLFRGWGAVLCRNIPQSVVKFMVYEQLMAWSREGTSPSFGGRAAVDQGAEVRHSMVCGAAAASIAACVTNPVDVVKTRIQTGPRLKQPLACMSLSPVLNFSPPPPPMCPVVLPPPLPSPHETPHLCHPLPSPLFFRHSLYQH